jgi:hypothetical protein
MVKKSIFLLLGCCLIGCLARVSGQNSAFGLGIQAGVSFTGWNLALVGQLHVKDFSAYLGPSVSLNRGLPGKGPTGLCTGVNYHLPSTKKFLSSLVNLDYQLLFASNGLGQTNRWHELHLSYGLEFHITPSIYVVQQLGYGLHFESLAAGGYDGRKVFSGYDGLLRLQAGYRF